MDKKLSDVYHGIIMEHNNNPVHFEKASDYDYDLNAYNPVCGDHFHVFLNIDNETVNNARFHGYGCAIAKASTSVLVQSVIGKPISELHLIIDEFKQIFQKPGNTGPVAKDTFLAFDPVNQFPSRIKCATLSWDELEKFLLENRKS